MKYDTSLKCPVEGCPEEPDGERRLTTHLRDGHGLSADEAKQLAKEAVKEKNRRWLEQRRKSRAP